MCLSLHPVTLAPSLLPPPPPPPLTGPSCNLYPLLFVLCEWFLACVPFVGWLVQIGTGTLQDNAIELGFREDGALELRSSTEELYFMEPDRQQQTHQQQVNPYFPLSLALVLFLSLANNWNLFSASFCTITTLSFSYTHLIVLMLQVYDTRSID